VSDDETTTARERVGRSYRKLGAAGRRLLGARPQATNGATPHGAACNICRWEGDAFAGDRDVERSRCPSCGSDGRDRFLHRCLTGRVELHPELRVLACGSARPVWSLSRTGDEELRSHRGDVHLDLQDIGLPDACLDVVVCTDVLEPVPHTYDALRELRRVIAPGGHLLLQVPVRQGRTTPATRPEFHGDRKPVIWHFGFDLTTRLRGAGFTTALLCTGELLDAVRSGENPWTGWPAAFDVPDMLAGAAAVAGDLVAVADRAQAAHLGLTPGYRYLTWHGRVPE